MHGVEKLPEKIQNYRVAPLNPRKTLLHVVWLGVEILEQEFQQNPFLTLPSLLDNRLAHDYTQDLRGGI